MTDSRTEQSSGMELREYARIVWLRKWTAMFVTAIVFAGVMFLSFRQNPVFESSVKVLVPPPAAGVTASGGIVLGKISLDDEAQIATSEPVAAAVAKSLNLTGPPSALLADVNVAPFKATQSVLLVQADNSEADQAAKIAHEFAVEYLTYRQNQNVAVFSDKLTPIKAQIAQISKQMRTTSRTKDATTFQNLAAARATLTQQRNQIESAIEQVKGNSGAILTDAVVPVTPVKPNHIRDGVLALAVGLVLGIGAAFLRDYIDDTLRGTEDVERQSGAPLVGAIPKFSEGRKDSREKRLIFVDEPRAPAAEAYRTLRTNLLFLASTRGIRRIVVTSPRAGEGKSTTAANLAAAMAQAGQRVTLADADLRRPAVHQFFGIPNAEGLSSVLSGLAPLESVVRNPGIPGLRLVTGGPIPPNPVELLGSAAMSDFLAQVSQVSDWLILDAPPVLGLADSSVLANQAEGVLLVIGESTNRRVLSHAREQLDKVDARIVGAVLNNVGSAFLHYYSEYSYSSDGAEGAEFTVAPADGAAAEPTQPRE